MRTILSTTMQPPMLHTRRGFFFDPPMGDGRGEGGVTRGDGGAANQQQQSGGAANQQQGGAANQQQQQQAPADPFAGIDLDMQPDHVRQAIETSRATLQSLQTQAAQGATTAQQLQQLQQQLQQTQQQLIQTQRGAPQQQQRQPQEEMTVDQQLEQYYLDQGLPAEQAKKIATMNRGAFEIFGSHLRGQISQQMGPIAGSVIENRAIDAFQSTVQNLGWADVPEFQPLQQALWEKTDLMAKQGQIVNPAVVENLAKILYFDHIQAGGTAPSNVVPINPPPHSIPNMTPGFTPPQQTRFSYPGAGNFVTQRVQNRTSTGGSPLDPETAAAIAMTTGNWAKPLQDALQRKQAGAR